MSAINTTARVSARRVALRRSGPVRRFQSTQTAPQSAGSSHVAAGVAGGAAVLLVGYGFYHFSGIKTAVNTVQSASSSLKSAKGKIEQATPEPKVLIGWLRSVANSYAAAIPGASFLLDKTFDQLEELADTHADDVKRILNESYQEIQKLGDGAKGKDVGEQVTILIQNTVRKIQKVAQQANKDYLSPLIEKNPSLKKALEGSEEQLQNLASKHGPKAQKIADDTMKQIKEISDKGLNGQTIAQIVSLVQSKSKEVASLAEDAGKDVYSELQSSVGPMMNNLPDVKKLLDDNVEKLKSVVGDDGVKQIKDLYKSLEDLQRKSKDKDPKELAKEAKDLINSRVGDIQSSLPSSGSAGSLVGSASAAAGSIPGLSSIVNELPHFRDLKEVADKHGEEGQKLLKSTYSEIKELLEKKGKEAKDLASKAKDDAKKSS